MGHAAEHMSPAPEIKVRGAKDVKVLAYEMSASDRSYLVEALRGLGVTFRHFFENFGTLLVGKDIETVPYPDKKRPYAPRFRAQHRLLQRADGTPRCVACFMCQTACPAFAIHIEAKEREGGETEKMPAVFEIDELRCVDCGLCVEACPCDAIRMDSGIHPAPALTREDTLFGKRDLLKITGGDDGIMPRTARTLAPLADDEPSGTH